MNGAEDILSKYGTSLKETRAMLGELMPAIRRRRETAQYPFLETTQYLTAEEVRELELTTETGLPFELEEGWTLKITPGANGAEPSFSFITPEKWEILEDQTYISPEGERFSWEEIQAQLAAPEIPLEMEQIFGKVFPERELEELLASMEISPEMPVPERIRAERELEEFWNTLLETGRTPETEQILRWLGATEEEIDELFAPPMGITEMAKEAWRQTPWMAGPARWGEVVEGFPDPMEFLAWLAPTKFGATLGVVGAYIEKYVGRPWEVAVLEANIHAQHQIATEQLTTPQLITPQLRPRTAEYTPWEKEAVDRLEAAFKKYGWTAIYSEEVSRVWEFYWEEREALGGRSWTKEAIEWCNPAFWIPIGGAIGIGAKYTSRIPILGRSMKLTAGGVLAAERGVAKGAVVAGKYVTYPVWKPASIAFEKLGEGLGKKVIDRLIGQSEHLIELNKIPALASEEILSKVLVDNWMKRVLVLTAKIPPIRAGIEKALGWRILVRREGQAVADIVGRAAVLHSYFSRMGINIKNPIVWSLRSIEGNPVRFFGFNKQAFSNKMFRRLLPEHRAVANAGTLEHVFTHPEMYSWTRMERGLTYVTRVNEINSEVLALLKAEGVAPAHVIDDWIHRVVVSEGARLRKGGRGIGSIKPYEKPRQFETMAEGIEWFQRHPELGAHYASNPEIAVAEYVEQAFRNIADERFVRYLAGFEEIAGLKPSQRLLERFPELAQRAVLRAEELVDANHFVDLINRVLRGERLTEQTLRAMERRFPELGHRLRALVQEPAIEAPIRDYLTGVSKKLPTVREMEQMFQAIGAGDRLAYRLTAQRLVTETGDRGAQRILRILDKIDTDPGFIPRPEMGRDLFTYPDQVYLRGIEGWKPISQVEYEHLARLAREANLPPPEIAIRPQIAGIEGLGARTQIHTFRPELPPVRTVTERNAALEALRNEIRALAEARKVPFYQARAERAFRMEQIRQPGIGEGYIMQPFAGGRIFGREFIDAFNKFFGHEAGLGVLRVTSDIAGILRITKAALDFSMMAIQGLPAWGLAHAYMLINPPIGLRLMGSWYKALFEGVGIFFNRGILARTINNKMAISSQRIMMGGSSRAIDYFATLEAKGGLAGITERFMKRIPGEPYHRAEASFFGTGEIIRNDFWEILSPRAFRLGKEFQLARFLDIMTGIADARAIGVPLTVRQLEQSFMWFAPNYTRACLTILSDIFRGGYTGAMARKALGGMVAAFPLYYSAVQFGISILQGKTEEEAWEAVREGFCIYEDPITGEVTWKPSARFGTLKVENYYFGVGGFWYGLLRLGGNIMACINEVGDRERIDLVRIIKHGSFNKYDNPFIYWWFCRASPFFGSGFELAVGKDFLGYPIETPAEYLKYIATRFEPIWMEQGINWLIPGLARDNEIPEGAARIALAPLELFGLRTFPESTWVRFYDKVNEYIKRIPKEELDEKQIEAWMEGKLEWRHLTEIQRMNLLSRYPELNELYEEAQADSAVRDSLNWRAWEGRMDEERAIYYERIDELTDRLLRGEIDTREYRERCGEAGMNYGSILEAIERDPNYAEIYDYFAKKEAEGDEYGFLDDIALGEYLTQIAYAEDLIDEKGDYDWDERDRRIDAFIEKWGLDTYERLQEYIAQKKGLAELNEVWIRKAQDTEKLGRGYWRLPYKPIIEMDESDEAEGNIPAEYLSLWKQYQALTTDAEREAFIAQHPELAKDWRAEYRLEHPEDDARLALWGYGGRIQSMEAYNFLVQWSKELGIPLEQMGLGLPPKSLIESYFEYNQLVIQFSGNSAEAKLWRLEHPDFTNWARENWGWEGTLGYRGMEYYRLQIKWRNEQAEYDALANKEVREEYLNSHPEFRDDRRRLQAMEYEFPEDLIPAFVDWYNIGKPGDYQYDYWYEDDWFLMEHPEFSQAMLDWGIWTRERDFSKVPTREVWELFKQWKELPLGSARREFEARHPDLDMWLHLKFGTMLETER